MSQWLQKLLVSTAKELTVCFRDPDVFIYSILLPALIYPLLLFFGSEFLLWKSGATEHVKVKVSWMQPMDALMQECKERIAKAGIATEVSSADPVDLLKKGRVDAVIGTGQDKKTINILIKGSSPSAADVQSKLEQIFQKWQSDRLEEQLKRVISSEKLLQVFSVSSTDVAPSTAPPGRPAQPAAPLGTVRMVIGTLLCLACSSVAYGALAPVVCLFTEERERATLPTTLLVPAPRNLIIAAKLAATTIVALFSGLVNIVNFSLVGLVLLAQVKILPFMNFGVILAQTLGSLNTLVIISLMIGLAITVSSVMATAAASARDYSQAYNLLSLPLLWCSVLPIFGALPVVRHLEFTAWLPVANMAYQIIDVLNRDVRGLSLLIAVSENLILSVVCTVLIKIMFTSQRALGGPAS